jgi:hypothetical protein
MRFLIATFLLALFILPGARAQDTLPKFSASLKASGKVLISWRNNYPVVNQISIQRSSDSLHNFTTLLTVPDPTIPENGFVDSKAQGTTMYYRIFILFGNSKYLFTKSLRPVPDVVEQQSKTTEVPEEKDFILPKIDNQRIFYMQEKPNLKKPVVTGPAKIKTTATIQVEKIIFIKRRDSLVGSLAGNRLRHFSDSVLSKTKDTLLFLDADTIQIKSFIEPPREVKEVYKISPYVFTAKDGNVNIQLADYSRKKYSVKFFEQDNSLVLEVKDIKDPELIIDKVNFGHAGWFRFELYEDGKLKEKNKLLITKDF